MCGLATVMANSSGAAEGSQQPGSQKLTASDEKLDRQRNYAKDLLASELVTREEHLLSLLHSKGPPKTFRVRNTALERAKKFLPEFQRAEMERLKRGGDTVNIEVEEKSDGPMIEMDFALVEAAESDPNSSQSDSDSDSSDEQCSLFVESDGLVAGHRMKLTSRTCRSHMISELTGNEKPSS